MFRKRRLTTNLAFLSIVPLLIFGVLVTMITSFVIYRGMSNEVRYSLNMLAYTSYEHYDLMYPGAFHMEKGQLFKGDQDLANTQQDLDHIKEMTGTDATIFIQNERYLTTIMKEDGESAVHTTAADVVTKEVLKQKKEYFSDHVSVNGNAYFGYYMPLYDEQKHVVGMLFVGKPSAEVMSSIKGNILIVCVVALLIMVIALGIAMFYGRKIITDLNKCKEYLKKTANGDLIAQIDPEVLKRKDEIGEMGTFAVMMQHSLSDMVGKDPLTGLHNRRSCQVVMQSLMEKHAHEEAVFAIAMGDIDLFKRINDTYGHQAGDHVLKELSHMFQEHMEHKGFVFRWGGEEFLLIFEGMDKEQAYVQLKELQKSVKEANIQWNHQNIAVSITFGVTDSGCEQDIETLIEHADTYLYLGKKEGRDRIIKKKDY